MDLTSGLLLLAIGIPVSVAVMYVIIYAMKKEYENKDDTWNFIITRIVCFNILINHGIISIMEQGRG